MTVLDDTGTMITNSEKRYLPLGDVRTDLTITNQTDFGYTGQRKIEGSELTDYRYRFLSNHLARFTQPDSIIPNPANPQTLNRYTYVNNNPIRWTDPTGHYIPEPYDGDCKSCPPQPVPEPDDDCQPIESDLDDGNLSYTIGTRFE